MKHTHRTRNYALIALMAIMGFVNAKTALIDFGRANTVADPNAQAVSPYNSAIMIGATTGDVALIDTDTVMTGWTVSVTENGNGNGGSAGATADVTAFPPGLAGFDAAALKDSIFANQGTPPNPSMILLFSGLSPTGNYNLLLYGSRANAQGADQRWSLTKGTGGENVDQFSEQNATIYVDWKGIVPDASGQIEVTINSPGPDLTGALALNFASVTETSTIELITSFTTDTETASPGNPATLSWEVIEPFDTLILDDGEGNTTDLAPFTAAGMGSTMVSPTMTTTYSIRAVRGGDSHVLNLTIVSGEAPAITSFTASADVLAEGSSIDLTWAVIGANTLVLNPGATNVLGTTTINLSPSATTTYTLTATNSFGSTSANLNVEVLTGPFPTHRNIASSSGNTGVLWLDQLGNRDWTLVGATLNSPLTTPSAHTNITAAYTTTGGIAGGATPSFEYPELTAEVWFRPGTLSPDHQVIFETGGGQNGLSAMITDSYIRLIGSSLNVRTLDVTIPIAGLNLDDFLQLVITNNAVTDAYTASVRDTFGNVRTVSETADITVGVNGAGLFVWAYGAIGNVESNLGGRTDPAGTSPAGLTGFTGEIGMVNVYSRILGAADIQAAFDRVATIGVAPSGLAITGLSFDDTSDQLTITWNSINGFSYRVQFSTTMAAEDQWFDLAGPFTASSEATTQVLSLPPSQPKLFVRVLVD